MGDSIKMLIFKFDICKLFLAAILNLFLQSVSIQPTEYADNITILEKPSERGIKFPVLLPTLKEISST